MDTFFIGFITLLFGAVVGLAGYQLYRVLLPIWGFIAGFVWGAHIVDLALGEGFLSTVSGWGIGIVVGIAGALLAYAFYQAAVAILVGLIGFYATYGLMLQIDAQAGALTALISLLAAAALASMVIYFRIPKAILIGLTALVGAATVMGGVLVMSGQIAPTALAGGVMRDIINGSAFWAVTWAALAILGVSAQALIDRSLDQSWEKDFSLSDRSIAGALGGEVKKEQPVNYNRFDDDEVDTVQHIRQRENDSRSDQLEPTHKL